MSVDVQYDSGYYARLYALEAANFWFRARNRLLLWALERFAGPGAARYLEIGCGTGFVLQAVETHFPAWTITGSEVLDEGLAFARTRASRCELRQLDARHMPYAAELDVVGAFDVLEHLQDDEDVLKAIHGALKPGGLVVLTVPQHRFLWSAADEHACHVRRYEADELRQKLVRAGFTPVLQTGFVSFLLPMMAASRLLPQAPGGYRIERELSVAKPLNYVFERLMDLERVLIRAGIRFPFGGSLLAVAQRGPDHG